MQRAASLIGKLKLPAGADSPEERAKAAWSIAAGKKIARHSTATRLVRNTLVIEVADHVWQKQLYPLRGFLLKNLEEILGEPMITDLDFRPMSAAVRRGPQRAASASGSSLLQEDPNGISDPFLALLYRQSEKREATPIPKRKQA